MRRPIIARLMNPWSLVIVPFAIGLSVIGHSLMASQPPASLSGEAMAPEEKLEPLPPVPQLPPHVVAIARLRLRESTLRVDPMSDFNLIRNVAELQRL